MPLTLQQAKVGLADKVVQTVIDEFRRESVLLDRMVFDDAVSAGTGGSTLTYGYLRLLTPSVAAGRAINANYTAGEALKVKKSTDLKIFGGAFEVDRVLEDSAAQSEITFQLQQKTIATVNKFHYDFINGDSSVTPEDFDGLDKMLTGASTEATSTADLSTAANIKANASEFALELDNMLAELATKPDMLLVNSKMATALKAVARELGYYTRSENAFGQGVDNYDGIAIVDLGDYFDGSQTKSIVPTAVSGKTDIYAVKLGLDAVHGASISGSKIVNVYLPDMSAPGAVKKGEVEMVCAPVLKNSKMAGVLRGVKIA